MNYYLCLKEYIESKKPIVILAPKAGVNRDTCRAVAHTLKEFYSRVESIGVSSVPDYIEVYLHQNKQSMASFVLREAQRVGALITATYTVMYEAWTGIPRLHVSLEEYKRGALLFRAFLLHEAAHSILHNSLTYYIILLPEGERTNILCLNSISAACKDIEVYALLEATGYKREIETLAEEATHTLIADCRMIEDFCTLFKDSIPVLYLNKGNPGIREDCWKKISLLYREAKNLVARKNDFSKLIGAVYKRAIEIFSTI